MRTCRTATTIKPHPKKEHTVYNYQSEATQFLNDYLDKHPEEAEQRLKNRHILWDVELNPEDEANFAAAAVPKKPYAYQPD